MTTAMVQMKRKAVPSDLGKWNRFKAAGFSGGTGCGKCGMRVIMLERRWVTVRAVGASGQLVGRFGD